ncbi:hypothetical protein ABB37_09613 [Leptomonas pyrrhocoris]|uniref:DUF1279 domain-containing protein n=1 Tax=Leptomonas pyrrhocoris TaxID=157538 RepID=A0A0N0DR63_LEPPY|nr:hypothetical protein ABB37_09613 [Leptomonas pyrrhocoris]XP_015652121.1 hypothetical protein ABB37_09613 [Leptomonas pyrrhocoris]KPA73681.1 hypothetical protein ABB37_09613 [Leptomonas pyrrhocoris]KPA73682.1 hypothetical protein ABB37_09613 [Leptomonas pyrrhocoris]|eukprot:XP_015652120.1 hypothetical protein ABB37_09613 [Leptomonas pyrrhocoris]
MLIRRFNTPRPAAAYTRNVSMKKLVMEYGAPLALYYFITNELLVCGLTYLLHYGYFGKEDLIDFLESVGASRYINLKAVEGKSWSFFDGRVAVSARLVANFTAASVFMSLWTPLQVPVCIATYPFIRRSAQWILRKLPVAKATE